MTKKILVIGAHSADFVWRAAGTIATITSQGGPASVIASRMVRGESQANCGRSRIKRLRT